MKYLVLVLAITLIVACTVTVHAGGKRTVPSTDHVPLGDWTYDAMISLASRGLIPGYAARVFEGDRLFNRMEMASVVALVVKTSGARTLTSGQVTLIDNLIQEFTPELMALDEKVIEQWKERNTNMNLAMGPEVLGTGYVRGSAAAKAHNDGVLDAAFRLSGLANLSDDILAVATIAQKEDKFFHDLREDPILDKALVQGYNGNLVWSLGKEYLNWGPEYSGSLILSDNSPGFPQVRGVHEFDLGRLIGRVKITEFGSMFHELGDNLFLFGRRYEKPIAKRWHLGISETAKTSKTPNPAILAMPFLLYQKVFGGTGSEIDNSFNAVYSGDLLYQTSCGSQVYGELLIDDISAPGFLGGGTRPAKTGFTLGFYIPNVLRGQRLSTFRAELIQVNRQTFEATRPDHPEMAYTHDGEIIGSAVGPNAKALYLRGEQYLSDKWSLIGEYFDQRQKDPGPPLRPRERSASLLASYDIAPDKSVGLRVSSFREASPGGSAVSGMACELRASFSF